MDIYATFDGSATVTSTVQYSWDTETAHDDVR